MTAMTADEEIGRRDRKEKEIIAEERKDTSVHRAFSLLDLQNEEPEPISWVPEELIPSGLALLCGPSKIGKSWLALELAVDVSEGKSFLGFDYQDYKPRTEAGAQPLSQEVIES